MLDIPPKVYVNWDFAGAQTDPHVWGSDSLEWRPQRWIQRDPATGAEILQAPNPAAEAAYNAWSGGPRVCPGKVFSQVEIVALLAVLLKAYRISPMLVPERGNGDEEKARAELISVLNDLELPKRVKSERMRDAGIVITKI